MFRQSPRRNSRLCLTSRGKRSFREKLAVSPRESILEVRLRHDRPRHHFGPAVAPRSRNPGAEPGRLLRLLVGLLSRGSNHPVFRHRTQRLGEYRNLLLQGRDACCLLLKRCDAFCLHFILLAHRLHDPVIFLHLV